jgi:predicted alpha-1,2-mannosidase
MLLVSLRLNTNNGTTIKINFLTMKKIILVFFFFISAISFGQNNLLDLTQYVNPFIGTGGHGHTYPGATVPFGMVQLSPDTRLEGWDGCSGYHYSDSVILGFSHMHLSGTGVPDYCDILFMPANYDLFKYEEDLYKLNSYSSPFDKKNEYAEPGFYSVILNNGNIKVELTATKRAGFHKYSFNGGGTPRVVIDLKHRYEVLESDIKIISSTEIQGYRRSKYWAKDKRVYFYAKFSKPFKNYYIFQDDKFGQKIDEASGINLKTVLEFDELSNVPLNVKVGISAVSEEGAKLNVNTEIPDWNFDGVKKQAKKDWNKELNKIQVEGGTKDQKIVFYTALYHTMVVPNLYMDVDGQFRGTDLQVHKTEGFENYTVFSLWDTYRAYHPLMTIIDQKRTKDYINTFLKMYEYRGLLPVWELSANETYCMIGYHSVPVIVDAYIKGIRGFDEQLALKAMKHSADTSLFGLVPYRQYGFVPQDKEHESVSKTLEYGYDDWCIAQFAKDINNDDYKNFIERAQSYKNVFDPSTGLMRAKINGGWYKPFNPFEVNSNYTEADAWQYSFYVPQDMTGFIKLHGGKDKL